MVMLTYRMPDEIQEVAKQGEFDEFDLNLFFAAEGRGESARFKYENEVQKWLDLIRGSYLPASIDDLKLGQDKRPPMPFSDARLLNVLSHTLWFLPNVASCFAMANLLKQRQNRFYHDYKVIVCAGAGAGIGLDALRPVQANMGDPLETKTITLTCGKLTTGVTVKPWTGIFMLRNLNSDLTTIINKSEAVKKAKEENPDPTPKEKKELSAEEKEVKSKRKQIQEKLIKFATRIPVFMYLTDYRERCLKDVITQLEPGLFKKVTGLSVEDFNMLCSLGVFNAPLMNDAIFKFKRYEDASLTYTGIDKHADDEVGGWDTTIRKTQYERLFYNQQSSMDEVDYSAYSKVAEPEESTYRASIGNKSTTEAAQLIPIVLPQPIKPTVVAASSQRTETVQEPENKLDSIGVDSTVIHKKFGKGTVVKINRNEKFIHIKFVVGEKKFVFPDAFVMGFLELK